MKKFINLTFGLVIALGLTGWFIQSGWLSNSWTQIYNHRLFFLHQCLVDGQIPCRYVMDMERMFGSPVFNYIGPLPYYLGDLAYRFIHNISVVVKLLFLIGGVGSLFFSYLLIKRYRSERVALVGSVVYLVAALVVMMQGFGDPLSKLWTMMWLPGVLLALRRLWMGPSLLNGLMLGGFVWALLLSRMANFSQFVPLLVIVILVWWLVKHSWRFLVYSMIGVMFGVWLGAFYLLPMTFERHLAFLDPLTQDYVPQTSAIIPTQDAPSRYEVLAGETQVLDFSSTSNWFRLVGSAQAHSVIRIYQFYYPNWVVTVNGQEVNPNYSNNSLGLITILLGQGDNQVIEGRFKDTPVRVIGNWLSVIGLVIFIFLVGLEFRRPRRWILYYLNALNW